ncbi:MAG: pilus (MSHA type) biogenesis protein MshL [Azoarcus sp.]|jgi:MSHA biogenesis protein MshL|nr:pilus (MSHA type) biogenesis protein MshL [Azoarcus sp.]
MKYRKTASRKLMRPWVTGLVLVLVLSAAGCTPLLNREDTYERMRADMAARMPERAAATETARTPPPPEAPLEPPRPDEPRFDLSVRDAPAGQVFMAIVNDSHYSMILPPDLGGVITVNLKDVTVREALELIRDIYGYNFRIRGTRISISANTPQTRIFRVSYLAARRGGASSTQVISSSMPTSNGGSGSSSSSNSSGSGASSNAAVVNTSVFTGQASDFWLDLGVGIASVMDCEYKITSSQAQGGANAIDMSTQHFSVGKCPEGRRFVMNQQSGVVMVRALPGELREIDDLLKALQGGVERQVMLEAKLIEVELNDGYQTGINWTAFDKWGRQVAGVNAATDGMAVLSSLNDSIKGNPERGEGPRAASVTGATGVLDSLKSAGDLMISAQGRLGSSSFAMIIDFLKTQGSVYVMSSPRIATLNNQKAVLKVGVDDYFVTEVTNDSSTSNYGSGTTNNMPSIKVSPFFSGIALDVTPQIDENGMVTLHIRPAVTDVTTRNLVVNLGEQIGSYTLPLASSSVKETDSIVRVRDGFIVAIGGLMSQAQSEAENKVPGLGDIPLVGNLFRNSKRVMKKREMVVLVKPTVIHDEEDWQDDMDEAESRLQEFDPRAYPRGFLRNTTGREQSGR